MILKPEEQQTLLILARDTIVQKARHQEAPPVEASAMSDKLQQDGASFVTLTKQGRLRGCVGSLEARHSLAIDVQKNALGAAFQDPRFSPVGPEELDDLHIEISVLSIPQPLSYDGTDDLIAQLRPGVDGVVIENDWNRATFLPQVWEKLPDPHQFLQRLCLKAHLSTNAYRQPGLDVYTYQVEKFEE